MEARQAIDELCATFLDAYNRGDAAALATGYTEDCAVMVPNQQTLHGKLGVEMFFKEMIKEFGGTASLENVEVVDAGNIAYQWATYTIETGDSSDVGQIIQIYNRQADGAWKLHREIFNSDNPE